MSVGGGREGGREGRVGGWRMGGMCCVGNQGVQTLDDGRSFYSFPPCLYAFIHPFFFTCPSLLLMRSLLICPPSSFLPDSFFAYNQPSTQTCVLSLFTYNHCRPDDENIDTKIMEAVKARLPPKGDEEEGRAAAAAAAAAAGVQSSKLT